MLDASLSSEKQESFPEKARKADESLVPGLECVVSREHSLRNRGESGNGLIADSGTKNLLRSAFEGVSGVAKTGRLARVAERVWCFFGKAPVEANAIGLGFGVLQGVEVLLIF